MNNEKLKRRINRRLAREIRDGKNGSDQAVPFGMAWAGAMKWARDIVNKEFENARKAKR